MLRPSLGAEMTPRPHPCKHRGDAITLGERETGTPIYWCGELQEICSESVKLKSMNCCRECPHYQSEATSER